MLICAGSEAAKWSAIQEAAHFQIVLGKKTETISKARASSGKLTEAEREKNQICYLCHLSHCFVKKKTLHTKKCFL